ncbi:MAG: lactonase family protein [Planctomycetia bacterium]|nr:lactonase family protein [Planctomycetia bacterium]
MSLDRRTFLMASTALAAGATLGRAADANKYWVFIGCYTGGKGGSKGIGRCAFDPATGQLGEPETAAEMGSPSFLAIHPNGKFLYAVGEGGGKDGGPVVAFALDSKTGKLEKLNQALSGGSGPCHVSVHPKGSHVIVANYGGGSTKIIALEDGKLNPAKNSFMQHNGSGPNANRQKEPHAHCSFFDPSGRFALTVDLGTDLVWVWNFEQNTGTATGASANISTPPGSGPRHIAIAPDGKFAYVCGELDSTVNVIQLDLKGGTSKVVQSLSTLKEPVKNNSTAECILHPNGKFVYVSNRVGNSIAAFKVGVDRKLTAIGHITGDINIPRNFNIDPTGSWMLVANQDGHTVRVFKMQDDGLATPTDSIVKYGSPVCVKFAPMG